MENEDKKKLPLINKIGIVITITIGVIFLIYMGGQFTDPYQQKITQDGRLIERKDYARALDNRIERLKSDMDSEGDIITGVVKRQTKDMKAGYDYRKRNTHIIITVSPEHSKGLDVLMKSDYFKFRKTDRGHVTLDASELPPNDHFEVRGTYYYTDEKNAEQIRKWMKKDPMQQYHFDPEYDPESEGHSFIETKDIIKRTDSNDELKKRIEDLKDHYIKHFGTKYK